MSFHEIHFRLAKTAISLSVDKAKLRFNHLSGSNLNYVSLSQIEIGISVIHLSMQKKTALEYDATVRC